MLTYIDDLIGRFFDPANYPAHAALAQRSGKKLMRNVQTLATDLRRHCAPQRNTEWWPTEAVRKAVKTSTPS